MFSKLAVFTLALLLGTSTALAADTAISVDNPRGTFVTSENVALPVSGTFTAVFRGQVTMTGAGISVDIPAGTKATYASGVDYINVVKAPERVYNYPALPHDAFAAKVYTTGRTNGAIHLSQTATIAFPVSSTTDMEVMKYNFEANRWEAAAFTAYPEQNALVAGSRTLTMFAVLGEDWGTPSNVSSFEEKIKEQTTSIKRRSSTAPASNRRDVSIVKILPTEFEEQVVIAPKKERSQTVTIIPKKTLPATGLPLAAVALLSFGIAIIGTSRRG